MGTYRARLLDPAGELVDVIEVALIDGVPATTLAVRTWEGDMVRREEYARTDAHWHEGLDAEYRYINGTWAPR